MPRGVLALVLSIAVASTACTPVAVGAVVAGGGSLIGAKVIYEEDCDGEGCVYGNVMAILLGIIGLGLLVGGGIALSVDSNSD